jgi:hypothetical protein
MHFRANHSVLISVTTKDPPLENTLSPVLAGFIEQIDLVDSTESQFRKQMLKSARSHENKDLKEFITTGPDQLYMDVKTRGGQDIALEGSKRYRA